MLEFRSAVRREKATHRMRFSRLTKDGQLRIPAEGSPRQGSSLLIGIIGSLSKLFRMIFLHIYDNKSFVVIFLRKNRGGGGVEYLTQNFKSGPGLRPLAWHRHSCLCSSAVASRTMAKSRRMRTYEFAELKAPLE
jgi:hypothetical protein